MANFCSEISGSICSSFSVRHLELHPKPCVLPFPGTWCSARSRGRGWLLRLRAPAILWKHPRSSCQSVFLSDSCPDAVYKTKTVFSQTACPEFWILWWLLRYSSNKESVLAASWYYECDVHRDTTAVKLESLLWIVGFMLVGFNVVNEHGTERLRGKLFALFSCTKYWESREFSSCLSSASASRFLFSLNV